MMIDDAKTIVWARQPSKSRLVSGIAISCLALFFGRLIGETIDAQSQAIEQQDSAL